MRQQLIVEIGLCKEIIYFFKNSVQSEGYEANRLMKKYVTTVEEFQFE